MKRALKPEDSALIFIIGFVLYQALGFVLATIFPNGGDWYTFLAYAVPQICYIGTVAVYSVARKTEFKVLPERGDAKPLHYVFALVVGLGIFFFALLPNYGMQMLFAKIGKNPVVPVPDMTKPGNAVAGAFIICLLPAIGEELVFRKAFCDGFKKYGDVPAIILSGVIFGLSHMNLAQTVHQIFLGLALAYIYIKTGNITLTMAIHLINNLLALFLDGIGGGEIWNNLTVLGICCAVGAVALVGGLVGFFFKSRRLEKPQKRESPSAFIIGFIIAVAALWLIVAIVS